MDSYGFLYIIFERKLYADKIKQYIISSSDYISLILHIENHFEL